MGEVWAYRNAWDRDYRSLIARTGMTVEEIAAALGRSVPAIHNYRRKPPLTVQPPEEVIRKFAALCGTSPYSYMDDPRTGDALGLETYAGLPRWQIDILQRQARLLDGTALPPEEWERLMDSLAQSARALSSLYEAARKNKT